MTSKNCNICGKEYATSTSLQRHLNKKVPCKKPEALIQQNVNHALQTAGLQHLEIPTKEFRDASTKFHSSMTHDERVKEGIFFTPKKVRDILFAKLTDLNANPLTILEPSFGSGEFLLDAKRLYPKATVVGVEKNEALYSSLLSTNIVKIHKDFLEYTGSEGPRFDLILGNPPYFLFDLNEMSKNEKKTFHEKNSVCMTGRPNIYVSFIYKCLHTHLADNGYLAFIIPTSIYNVSYYQPMRDYIHENTTIVHLESLNKPGFYETMQDTCLIILQKGKRNDDYIFRSPSGTIYITPYYKELTDLCRGTTTLTSLGLDSKTGNVVWNQVKDDLADTGTLLIYASNITNSKLELNNLKGTEKKQYVKNMKKTTISGPVILVDRGYGNTFKFNTVLVNIQNFYAENHVNVIYPTEKQYEKNLQRVVNSFQDERTKKFISWFVGNGMMSSSELENVLPIF